MALNRRQLLAALSGMTFSLACGKRAQQAVNTGYVEIAAAGSSDPSSRTIVVCMPDTTQTREVWTGLKDELEQDYRLVAVAVSHASEVAPIAEAIRRYKPAGLVLMNNPTTAAYRSYQLASGLPQFPPAVIVMASFLDGHSHQIQAATGISYEIPLITVVTNLRKLLASPIERIGVIVRAPLRQFVERQAALARREQISVVAEEVSMQPNASELKRALRRIKHEADAVWVLNDDRLLSPRLITEAWLPGLNERPWCPAIVGAASLVSPVHSFGTFAMLPDHTALGAQAASVIFDIADNGWQLRPDADVQLPLSTTTTMDRVQVDERFALRKDALLQVDRILQ